MMAYYETKTLQKCNRVRFVLVIYYWACDLPLSRVCTANKILLEKNKFSFASGNQLEIASGLGIEAYAQFLPQS